MTMTEQQATFGDYSNIPTIPPRDFEQALTSYVTALTVSTTESYRASYPNSPHMTPPTFETTRGPRFVKVIRCETFGAGRSVFCFIDQHTGDIYKPASFKAPAKGVRGSIYRISSSVLNAGGLYR